LIHGENMDKTIKLDKAFHLAILKKHNSPVITHADLYDILLSLYKNKYFDGVKIGKIRKDEPEFDIFKAKVRALENSGIISSLEDSRAYSISGKGTISAEQAGCYLYPFSNLCYLSAMEYHGLTERIPKVVQLMIPKTHIYQNLLKENYSKEWMIENIYSNKRNIKIRNKKISRKTFRYFETSKFTLYKEVPDSGGIRVSPIGRTFLDMFQKPSECGGFSHVLDVLEEYGERYQRLILKEFDKNGSNIDKSRLGFYLESVMGVKNKILDKWSEKVQRGSSRVFMPGGDFSPYYSERWCISINMEYLQQYGTRN